jgi:ubiquitin C-terminal hydrolase
MRWLLSLPQTCCVLENLNFKIIFVSGHYISDVYDIKKQAWFTYNDLEVSKIQEAAVQSDRDRSGYIFFYMHK